MTTADDTRATPAQPSLELARILHRLAAVHGKLQLAASHWKPVDTAPDDLGAVTTLHDAVGELDTLYCALADFGHKHKHLVNGALVESFEEAIQWLGNWHEQEVQEARS